MPPSARPAHAPTPGPSSRPGRSAHASWTAPRRPPPPERREASWTARPAPGPPGRHLDRRRAGDPDGAAAGDGGAAVLCPWPADPELADPEHAAAVAMTVTASSALVKPRH